VLPYSHAFFQGLNVSELLAFNLASVGSAILEVDDPQPDSTSVASQLLRVKDLLSPDRRLGSGFQCNKADS
jgi:hypothetical protein